MQTMEAGQKKEQASIGPRSLPGLLINPPSENTSASLYRGARL